MFTGFNTALKERGAAGCAAYARELGFSGIEGYPSAELDSVEQAREIKAAMANEGLVTSCFSYATTLCGEDADKHEDYLKHLIDVAHEMGSPYLHHTLVAGCSTRKLGQPCFDEVFEEVVERAGRVADYAAGAGMMCLYEDQGYLFNGADRFDRFMTAMNRKNVGVCADFGNILFAGETPESFIGNNSTRIYNVHIKDYLRKSGNEPDPGPGWLRTRAGDYLRDTVPGHGTINMVACLKLLQECGYDGYYALEFGGPEPYDWGTRLAIHNIKYYMELAKGSGKLE